MSPWSLKKYCHSSMSRNFKHFPGPKLNFHKCSLYKQPGSFLWFHCQWLPFQSSNSQSKISVINSFSRRLLGAFEKAQGLKTPAAQADDLNSIARAHMMTWWKEEQLPQVVLPTSAHVYIHTTNKFSRTVFEKMLSSGLNKYPRVLYFRI